MESLTAFLLVLANDTKNNKMSNPIYLHQPYQIGTIYDTAGQRQASLTDLTTNAGNSFNVASIASGADTQYQLNRLQTEIDSLKVEISILRCEMLKLRQNPPLTQQQIEAVTDEAYKSQTLAAAGAHGQQISIWDGIEPHVVRATERAHGIQ